MIYQRLKITQNIQKSGINLKQTKKNKEFILNIFNSIYLGYF